VLSGKLLSKQARSIIYQLSISIYPIALFLLTNGVITTYAQEILRNVNYTSALYEVSMQNQNLTDLLTEHLHNEIPWRAVQYKLTDVSGECTVSLLAYFLYFEKIK
jgi:hypothetical protein